MKNILINMYLSKIPQSMFTFFKTRPIYKLDQKQFIKENNHYLWFAAGVFVLALFIRSWEVFTHPAFYAEDATYYFKLNYNSNFTFINIFRNPNGYYNLFNNFIAQVIGQIDIRLQPLAYQTVATALSVITVILFSRTGLIKNRFLLLVTPLILGLSGLNHIFYFTTVTFQMYVLVLLLFALLFWEKLESWQGNLIVVILVPILVWSGPYSVLAVPFALVFILLFRGKTAIMLWVIAVTVTYVLSTTGAAGSGINFKHLFSELYHRLWFETLVGDVFIMGLRGNPNLEKALLFTGLIGAAIFAIRRDTFYLRILFLLMVLIVTSMAPLFLSNKYIFYRSVYPCHILIALFSWILFVLILLDRLLMKLSGYPKSIFSTLAMCGIVLIVIADNVKHKEKRGIDVIRNIPQFIETIRKYEKLNLEKNDEYVLITADGLGIFDPSVIVGSRQPNAKRLKKIFIPETPKD